MRSVHVRALLYRKQDGEVLLLDELTDSGLFYAELEWTDWSVDGHPVKPGLWIWEGNALVKEGANCLDTPQLVDGVVRRPSVTEALTHAGQQPVSPFVDALTTVRGSNPDPILWDADDASMANAISGPLLGAASWAAQMVEGAAELEVVPGDVDDALGYMEMEAEPGTLGELIGESLLQPAPREVLAGAEGDSKPADGTEYVLVIDSPRHVLQRLDLHPGHDQPPVLVEDWDPAASTHPPETAGPREVNAHRGDGSSDEGTP